MFLRQVYPIGLSPGRQTNVIQFFHALIIILHLSTKGKKSIATSE